MTDTLALGDLHLPRILCLHGGGMNAASFRLQCRALSRALQGRFRLVFIDGPYESPPDPAVLAAYAHLGPFRRWLRWQHDQPDPGSTAICHAIRRALTSAIERDNAVGAAGECVAIMGFSQGAKIAASLLLELQLRDLAAASRPQQQQQQRQLDSQDPPVPVPCFRFGVLLAARAPLVSLAPELTDSLALADANEVTTGSFTSVTGYHLRGSEHVLRIPTLHVHGLRDAGLVEHRQLLHDYCDPATASLVEWDGDHRVVAKSADVAAVVREIMDLARRTGVIQ